jgi:hypothetical protein
MLISRDLSIMSIDSRTVPFDVLPLVARLRRLALEISSISEGRV